MGLEGWEKDLEQVGTSVLAPLPSLFQTSHLNFPTARLLSPPLTNNVCVYAAGLRRGLILGLEISLEVPICSNRENNNE